MSLDKFTIQGNVLVKYNANETTVVLPCQVTEIDEWAFECCDTIAKVKMHEGITKIGKGAFYACTALESVHIPGSVCHIGYSAFRECKSLARVEFWDGADEFEKVIDERAFAECENLKSIILSVDVCKIGEGAFDGCYSFEAIYYLGDEEDFSYLEIDDNNECFEEATVYFYNSQKPKKEGNYWYYKNGQVHIWGKE